MSFDDVDHDALSRRLKALKSPQSPGQPQASPSNKTLKHEPDVDDLSKRFAAQSRRLKHEPDIDDLSSRFQALGGRKPIAQELPRGPAPQQIDVPEGSNLVHNEEDDLTVEDLLEQLEGDNDQFKVSRDEEHQARELMRQAQIVLKKEQRAEAQDGSERQGETDQTLDRSDEENENARDEQDVAEITEKAFAQARIDQQDEDQTGGSDSGPSDTATHHDDDENDGSFSLPSAPTELRAVSPPSAPPDEATTVLPSAPTFHPALKSSASMTHGFTDDDIETWCIICNDDATLRCAGCDGDLYCQLCWAEGHLGESAGFEERRHRAEQFIKGAKKPPTARRRVRMGAA